SAAVKITSDSSEGPDGALRSIATSTTTPICLMAGVFTETVQLPTIAIQMMVIMTMTMTMIMVMMTVMSRVTAMLDDFFIRALIAGIGVALTAGPLGCFVVWRRMA